MITALNFSISMLSPVRGVVEFYISNVASDVVKIIDIESYEREIPDEIVEVIGRVKDKFDQLYIVFTDYTGTVERQVEQEHRQIWRWIPAITAIVAEHT